MKLNSQRIDEYRHRKAVYCAVYSAICTIPLKKELDDEANAIIFLFI